ncbi:MAG: amidohydrolase family protein, partial [Methanosarcinaceae archaeon]|nr:amidohydrolase family protein [Methanosarcinaceae archaeon]
MMESERYPRANNRFSSTLCLRRFVAAFFLTLVACGASDKTTEHTNITGTFAIVNCVLIDGTGCAPVLDAVLVVKEGRILAAGARSSTTVPEAAQIVDVAGATVLPGFINAHVHSGFSEANLKAWARSGVTTVRDLCGPRAFALRDEWSTDPQCARLVAAGPMVSVPNGYPTVPWGSSCMLPVNSADDARLKVGALLDDGADIIKLAIESGASFNLVIPSLTSEEASAAVQVAHERGTHVSAHVLVSYDLGRALNLDVDDIAHMVVDELPDSLIAKMIQAQVFWVPTIELWQNVGNGLGDKAIHNLRRFVQAGGKVVLGTDYDGYDKPFQLGMPLHEMVWMLDAGMTPMQVIVAGTKN